MNHSKTPYIILLIGASGSGKTTVTQQLENDILSPDTSINYFDNIGIPSYEEMVQRFGSAEKWQETTTHTWINKLASLHDKKVIILEGSFNPDFAREQFKKLEIKNYFIICMHTEKAIRENRLLNRNQPELISADMEKFAQLLKAKCLNSNDATVYHNRYDLKTTVYDIKKLISEKSKLNGKTMDYNLLKVKSYKHWDLYLHENQCYLGRTFLFLKTTEDFDDFLAINGEVREEFFKIGQELKAALKKLFNPDKMNYAALSNTCQDIHVHFVPRYKETREFEGTLFTDTRWGKNYAPYDRDFIITEPVLFAIKDALKKQL